MSDGMKVVLLVMAALALVALGMLIGYRIWHVEPTPSTETFRPGHVQADGSADLTRIPTPPADAGPPPHQLPAKAKETARVHVRVHPRLAPAEAGQPACSCGPVDLDLSLYKSKDGTGVVASSEQGDVDLAHSTYTPLQNLEPPQYRHFLHLSSEPGRDNYAAVIGKRYLGNRFGVGLGVSRHERDGLGVLVEAEFNWR